MPAFNRHAVEVGVLAGIGNLIIFQHFMPPVTDVKSADQFNPLVESSERTALLVSVAFNSIIAGAVKSWDTFLIGAVVIVAIDYAYKHANAVNPDTGTMSGGDAGSMDTSSLHPLPNYEDANTQAG
jgi:uncharacterized membrane protein